MLNIRWLSRIFPSNNILFSKMDSTKVMMMMMIMVMSVMMKMMMIVVMTRMIAYDNNKYNFGDLQCIMCVIIMVLPTDAHKYMFPPVHACGILQWYNHYDPKSTKSCTTGVAIHCDTRLTVVCDLQLTICCKKI